MLTFQLRGEKPSLSTQETITVRSETFSLTNLCVARCFYTALFSLINVSELKLAHCSTCICSRHSYTELSAVFFLKAKNNGPES